MGTYIAVCLFPRAATWLGSSNVAPSPFKSLEADEKALAEVRAKKSSVRSCGLVGCTELVLCFPARGRETAVVRKGVVVQLTPHCQQLHALPNSHAILVGATDTFSSVMLV